MRLRDVEEQIQSAGLADMSLAYALIVAISGGTWLLNGGEIGSIAGGAFFAMVVCFPAYMGMKSVLASSLATTSAMVLALVMSMIKETVLMAPDWEPPQIDGVLAVVGFVAALVASAIVGAVRSELREKRLSGPATATLDFHRMVAEAKTLVGDGSALRTLGFAVTAAGVICAFLATDTTLISTARMAATRFAFDHIFAFETKRGLSYWIASRTDVRIKEVRAEGPGSATAVLEVTGPAVPFRLGEQDANSYSAKRRLLALPEAERRYLRTEVVVHLQRSGIAGWKVAGHDGEPDLLKLSEGYRAGRIAPTDSQNVNAALNLFMALDAASRPTNPLILASLVLGLGLIGLGRTSSQVLSGIGMGMTPLAMFALGMLAMNRPA